MLLPFLTGIFETEKPEDNSNSKNLKKLTKIGRVLLIGGLLAGLWGIFQTYVDDTTNEEKQKLAILKYESDRKIDSSEHANKSFVDSVNFVKINLELQQAKQLIELNKNNIIKNAIDLSKVALNSINEAKFPIPKKFIINLEAELEIPPVEKNEIEKLVEVYRFDYADKGAQGFGLDDANGSFFNSELLTTLHNFRFSSLDYEIDFYKKDNLLLSLSDLNKTNLNNYKTKNFRNIPAGLNNEIRLFYYPRTNKFTISFSQVEIEAKSQLNTSSLLNLKNCIIKIRFYGVLFSKFGKYIELKFSKINRIAIATPENLFLYFENLTKKDEYGRIITTNTKNDWK